MSIEILINKYFLAFILSIFISGVISQVYHPLYLFSSIPFLFCFVMPLYILSFSQSLKKKNLIFFSFLIFVFLHGSIGSLFLSLQKIRSFCFVLFYLFPYFLLCIPITNIERKLWNVSLFIIGIFIFLYFWYQIFTKGWGRWVLEGLFGGVNSSAALLNMIWPNLFVIAKYNKSYRNIVIYIFVSLLIFTAILSFSRMAIFTVCCLLLILSYSILRFRNFILLLAVITIFLFFFSERFLFLLEFFKFINFQADYPRTLIWLESIDIIKKHPIWGVGAGNAPQALSFLNMYHAHNNIIHIALELGIPIALISFIFELWLVYIAIKIIFLFKKQIVNLKYLGIACSIIAWILYSITAAPIEQPALSLMLVYCLRLIL